MFLQCFFSSLNSTESTDLEAATVELLNLISTSVVCSLRFSTTARLLSILGSCPLLSPSVSLAPVRGYIALHSFGKLLSNAA